jgi:FMN reductase
MSKILIISGSPSSVSRSGTIPTYIRNILKEGGNQVEKLVLRELPAEALVHAQFNHPEIKKAKKLVEESDALVVVSPIYKASYPLGRRRSGARGCRYGSSWRSRNRGKTNERI